jgi:hypothetical protein
LPADQAAPLWQTVHAQAMKALGSVKPVCVAVARSRALTIKTQTTIL